MAKTYLQFGQCEHVLQNNQFVILGRVGRRSHDADIIVVPVSETGIHLLRLANGHGAVVL